MIEVTPAISLDEAEITERFIRSAGPGGQNVNKVSTAVELRFDVRHSPSLPNDVAVRLMRLAGRKITQAEWDASHQQQAQRVRAQRPDIDPKLLDSPEARTQTLEALIREKVLATAADKLHLVVGNDRLQRLFVTDPQFAMLRNADNSIKLPI